MFEDLKIVFTLFVMAVMSAFVRFKSLAGFFTDALLGFLMGYSFYLSTEGGRCKMQRPRRVSKKPPIVKTRNI